MIVNDCISANQYSGGVLAIDAGFVRHQMVACYLIEAETEVAFIEVGTHSSTPRLMQVLAARGWQPEDVRYVIVTHVHPDHAGGAGSLMRLLPNATFLVHPYGARHMADPAKLEAGARAVYGDAVFNELYGKLIPVAQERLQAMEDGSVVALGSRQLRFMDAPGHARHHFCVHDSHSNGWFCGDTFGLSYREFDTCNGAFIFPTTTPIQFDPVAAKESIAKLVASQPDCMYLTHYGRVDDVSGLATQLLEDIDTLVGIARQHIDETDRVNKIELAIRDWLLDRLAQHGVSLRRDKCLQILQPDLELNAQGIDFWLSQRDG